MAPRFANKMSIEFIERASHMFGVATAILGALAAMAGVGAWYFSSKEADARGEALERFKEESKGAVAATNERAAQLEKEAAVARLELEQLKEKQRARIISEDQKRAFETFMEGKQKGPIRVMSISTNNEVKDYVNQIRALLDANGCGLPAGSPVRIVMGDVSISNHPEGTAILVRLQKNSPAYAGDVQKAFESIGIPMPGIEVPNEQNVVLESEVVVFVSERR